MVVLSADEAWVATSVDGLWHFRDGRWVRDNPPGSIGWPWALVRGPGDTIAVATDRQISIRRSGTWSVVLGASGEGPGALAFAPDGALWASTGDASTLVRLEWNGRDWIRQPVPPGPAIVAPATIGFDGAGGVWLIGGGWFPRSVRLVDGRWEDIVVGDGWEPRGGMAVDPEGTVWLALRSSHGRTAIGAFDGGRWRIVELDTPMSYLASSGFVAAPDGSLLVGGSEGLLRFARGAWEPVIPTGYVDLVAMGRDGSIWASGSQGLVRLHLERP